MICITLMASTNAALLRKLEQASGEPADLHELRLDTVAEAVDAEKLVTSSTRPVVAACPSREANGDFDGTAAERRSILLRAARAGAAYIAAEPADIPFLEGKVRPATLIVTFTDPSGTGPNLVRQVEMLSALPADWVGFSTTYRKAADTILVLEAIASCPKPCFGEASGAGGLATRVLGLAYGSRLVRASLETGYEAAPDRPTARDLLELYRVKELTKDTPVYGLLGYPLGHSRSFRLHNRAFAKLGLDAVHIPFETESAADFLRTTPSTLNLRGLSVTMPHKPAALQWADRANEFSRRIGAANTLTLTEKGWCAGNTDCIGAFESLKDATSGAGINLTGLHALVLGAGGTTRAAGLALTLLGCRVTVSARDVEKAWDTASQMGWDVEEWEEAPFGNWDVVANTTSAGLYPDLETTPFAAEHWRPGMIAFDTIHNPQETRFLRDAANAGCLTIDGVDMYLRHIAGQFRAWTGEEMPKPGLSARIPS